MIASVKQHARHKWDRFWEIMGVAGLWLAAAVGVAAIWIGTHDAGEQRQVMQGQLNVRENDKRPWVAIDAKIAGTLHTIPKRRAPNLGISVPVDFVLRNIGSSPAIFAKIIPLLAITGPPSDPLRFGRLICENIKTKPIAEGSAFAFTVFPGEALPPARNIFHESERSLSELKSSTKDLLGLVITGCVDYGFVGRPEHHQTGFAFEISRKAAAKPNGQCCAIDFWGNDVPAADLRISLYPFGRFSAD